SKREFKDSSRERIFCYNCNGKISIKIDIPITEAKVVLKHKLLHEKLVNVTTPSEIKQEISKNLDLNPLCQWHIDKAIKEKLKSRKKIERLNYNYEEVVKEEFTFVNSSFIPDLQRTDSECYIVCPPALCGTVIKMVRNHFNMYPKIPTNNGQFLSSKEIRTKAVFEIYEFCIANNLPRLDYLIWIICTRVIPDQANRLQQLLTVSEKSGTQGIRLIYSNFKRQTDYPFLIWDGTGSQNISESIEAFRIYNKVNMLNQNLTNENKEDITKRWQKIESKIEKLQYLVDHINEKLNVNNFQHVEAIINNLDRFFTIISDIEKAKNQK
ncbi:20457_t:CDS:2, partial [Gigaspora rosea]